MALLPFIGRVFAELTGEGFFVSLRFFSFFFVVFGILLVGRGMGAAVRLRARLRRRGGRRGAAQGHAWRRAVFCCAENGSVLCGKYSSTLRRVLCGTPECRAGFSGRSFPSFRYGLRTIALLNETSTQRYVTRRGLKSVFLFVSLRLENELLISIIYRIYEEMFLIGMRSVCLWLG